MIGQFHRQHPGVLVTYNWSAIERDMAARLPVAGFGDVRHIVSEPNKPLIVNRDAQALSDILSTPAGAAEMRDRIGQANRRHVENHYSQADMIGAYSTLFSA